VNLFGLCFHGAERPSIKTPASEMAINRLSNNVGGVKHFRAHYSMHSEEGAISLSLKVLPYQPRLARNQLSGRNSVRPMHLFGRTFVTLMPLLQFPTRGIQ
jgi:hypothetical protein